MFAKNDDDTRQLLKRAVALSQNLKPDSTMPRADILVKLCGELVKALENANHRTEQLERENRTLFQERMAFEQQAEALKKSNEGHERKRAGLERQVTGLQSRIYSMRASLSEKKVEGTRYRELFEYAPDAYLITDADGVIIEANLAAAELLNLRPRDLAGQPLSAFISDQDRKLFNSLMPHIRRIQDFELTILPHELPAMAIALTLSTVYDDSGSPIAGRWLLRDITDRRRALAALDSSERRFRAVFDQAMLGIVLIQLDGRISRANQAFREMLGYEENELNGSPITQFSLPDDFQQARAVLEEITHQRSEQLRIETRFLGKHGDTVWAYLNMSLLRDEQNQPQFILILAENVTAEKQTTAELAEARSRMLESSESERLLLAQELHDGPMQDLYGAVFRLSNYLSDTEDKAMQANLKEAQGILKNVASSLRTICGELRPPTLGNLGLERAIRSHAENLQDKNPDLALQLQLSSDGQMLPPKTRLAFFRIYQQCMANILRHSRADQALIAFHVAAQEITLDIWDNGCGFEMPEKWVDLLRQGHYGLAGIAERVQALGGTLKIETQPGSGTLVHVTAPIE